MRDAPNRQNGIVVTVVGDGLASPRQDIPKRGRSFGGGAKLGADTQALFVFIEW